MSSQEDLKLYDVMMRSSETDNVNSPKHYTQGTIEVIDFIIDQEFNYLEGNIIKYVSRYTMKNGLEDLKKAKWYLDKLIKETEGNG